MNPGHEFKRLKEAVRNKDRKRFNTEVATVLDVGPHPEYGYVTAELPGDRVINVQAWTSAELRNGQQVMVQPISGGDWNWWVLIAANGSSDPENTPFEPPTIDGAALPEHSLESHTGTLSWARIDTSTTRVDLTTQVTGQLPLENQELQPGVVRQTISVVTASIAPEVTLSGSVTAPQFGYVRTLSVTGGTAMRIKLYETDDIVEYETTSTTTPYVDYGGFMHAQLTDVIKWEIRNDGEDSAIFQLDMDIVGWP